MDTLKTSIVVVLLLAVLYGVYVTLNQPEPDISKEIARAEQQSKEPLQVDFGQDRSGTTTGVTASLGDSAPWSPDSVVGDLHDHNNTAGAPYGSPAISPAKFNYGTSSPPSPANLGVAAPDLITSPSDDPLGGTGSSDPYARPDPAPAFEPLGSPAGYAPDNAFRSNSSTAAAIMPGNLTNSNDSVYGQSGQFSGAPAGNYGTPPELSEYAQVPANSEPPVADSYAKTATSPSTISPMESSRIDGVVVTARDHIQQGQYYEALLTLSLAYDSLGISAHEREQLQTWLDPLAGKVLYSKEHLVGGPYQVQAGETLQSIATKYDVTWQLLANINGLRDPTVVQPGMSIKVIPGPFRAEIDIAINSLTLFTGRLYAGRFAITVNGSKPPAAGDYRVNDKQPGHSFYAGNAQTLSPQDANNPFGGIWIDLGGDVSIHGTSSTPGQSERLGCIGLADKDANDLYGILSVGSNVVIRR